MAFTRVGRPGLIGTGARTAAVPGTAQAVTGGLAAAAAGPPEPSPIPSPIPAPHAVPAAPEELVAHVERLGHLAAAGVLTPEEVATAKARLLAEGAVIA